jgi:hypothetical protein
VLTKGGVATTQNFGFSGPVSYAITLVPGNYVVELDPNVANCGSPSAPALLCNPEIVAGCP